MEGADNLRVRDLWIWLLGAGNGRALRTVLLFTQETIVQNNTESHPEAACSSRSHRGIGNDETLLNHTDKVVRTTRTTQEKLWILTAS